jgi:hypothetical protein
VLGLGKMRTVKLNKPAKVLALLVIIGVCWVAASMFFLSSSEEPLVEPPLVRAPAAAEMDAKEMMAVLRQKRIAKQAEAAAEVARQNVAAEEGVIQERNKAIEREAALAVGSDSPREALGSAQVEVVHQVQCHPYMRHQCVERSRQPLPISAQNVWQLISIGKGPE